MELITIRAGFNGECEMTMTSEDWHGVIVQLKTEIWEKSEYEEYAKWKKATYHQINGMYLKIKASTQILTI